MEEVTLELSSLLFSPLINKAKEVAARFNFPLYLVGGPLRDILLKREVKDIDLVIDGDIFLFAKELAKSLNGKVVFYPQFLTAKIEGEGMVIDLARTRSEIYERPAQLPKVSPARIEDDLRRRDFTINAIAYDLRKREFFDPFNGKEDLKRGMIRVLHPRSFIDDPTRILRGIRFAKRFGFRMEKDTRRWLEEAIKSSYLSLLSGERFLQELRLVMKEKNWLAMIKEINRLGIFKAYFGKNLPRRIVKSLSRIRKGRDVNPDSSLFYLLASFPTAKLPLNREEKREIISFQKIPLLKKRLARIKRPSTIYQLLKDLSTSALGLIKELVSKESRKKIEEFLKRSKEVKTILTGKELKKLGIKPEVKYGEFLTKILYQRLDGKIKTKEEELGYLRKLLKRYG